jgi:hypothetical protein
MVKQRTLTPSFQVRIPVPQLNKRLTKVGRFCFKWRCFGVKKDARWDYYPISHVSHDIYHMTEPFWLCYA